MTDEHGTLATIRKHLRVQGVDGRSPIAEAIAGAFAELSRLAGQATVLRPQAGDVIVLTLPSGQSLADLQDSYDRLRKAFPENQLAVVHGGELAIVRLDDLEGR